MGSSEPTQNTSKVSASVTVVLLLWLALAVSPARAGAL